MICDCRQPKNYKNPMHESKNEQQEHFFVKWSGSQPFTRCFTFNKMKDAEHISEPQ